MTQSDLTQEQERKILEGSRYKVVLQSKRQGGPTPEGFSDDHSVHLQHFSYSFYGCDIQSINPDGSFTSVRFQRPDHAIRKGLLTIANHEVRKVYREEGKAPEHVEVEVGLRRILDFA